MTQIFIKKVGNSNIENIKKIISKKHIDYNGNLMVNILMREIIIQVEIQSYCVDFLTYQSKK